jgi:hypothetical protein
MTYSATAAWLRPRLWIGLVAGMVPWAVWVASLALGGWNKDYEGTLIGADHLAFYTAAHLIRDGQQERMYDYRYLDDNKYEQNLIGWEWGGFEAFRNPPFYALLYWPTAGLSYYLSLLIWTAIGCGLLALSIWLLSPQRPGQALLWSVVFYPLFAAISFGQNTLLSLAVFSGVYRLLSNERHFSAGMVAGLLWFKPQLLLGLFVWWAFSPRKYLRCWLGVIATGLLLAAVSWGTLPKASRAFVDNIKTIVGFRGFALWNVHNPKAFFELLLPEHFSLSNESFTALRNANVPDEVIEKLTSLKNKQFTRDNLTNEINEVLNAADSEKNRELILSHAHEYGLSYLHWLLALLVSGFSVAFAWRISQRSRGAVATMFPVAVFLSLWASPHALIYEWTLLISACVVLWERRPGQRDCWLCLFVLAWIGLTISTPFTLVQQKSLQRALHIPFALQVSVPILGIVGYLAARELSIARSESEQK